LKTNRQYLSSGSDSGANSTNGKSSNMLDLLGIDLENDSEKNGAAAAADPWGMPIKTQPQSQVIHITFIFK
jgi:hypothetical protein